MASAFQGKNETILVVEDEPALRNFVTQVLRQLGYRALAAEHGQEALSVWAREAQNVALLLTDIVMPEGLSGLDLARELRARKNDLKVIYTSGYNIDYFGEDSDLREGVNFLPKPFEPRLLARTIRECLDT